MQDTIEITLEVNIDDEWFDEGPTHLKIRINKKYAKRIFKLSEIVKRNNLAHVADYDYPDFFIEDEDNKLKEWDGSTECVQLIVYNDSIEYRGYIKHTDVRFCSNTYNLEMLKVKMAPFNDLPLLLNKLTYEPAVNLLKERFKKGK